MRYMVSLVMPNNFIENIYLKDDQELTEYFCTKMKGDPYLVTDLGKNIEIWLGNIYAVVTLIKPWYKLPFRRKIKLGPHPTLEIARIHGRKIASQQKHPSIVQLFKRDKEEFSIVETFKV